MGRLQLADYIDNAGGIALTVPKLLRQPIELDAGVQRKVGDLAVLAKLPRQFQILHDQIDDKAGFQIAGFNLVHLRAEDHVVA